MQVVYTRCAGYPNVSQIACISHGIDRVRLREQVPSRQDLEGEKPNHSPAHEASPAVREPPSNGGAAIVANTAP
jgi:hypothetical protein